MPLPKNQRGVYGDPRAVYEKARGVLAGLTGLGDEPSVMDPEARNLYTYAELAGILSQLSPLVGTAKTAAKVLSTPSGLARYLAGHSPSAITATPATLRRVEAMSDDFYKQLADAKAAQSRHYEKLKDRYPTNTPQPADILSEMIDSPNSGRELLEITSPSRGWTVVDPKTGYVAGILSEGKGGESVVNPTLNALNRMYNSPLRAVAASQELAGKYRSLGLPVGADWNISVPKVRSGLYTSGTPKSQIGAVNFTPEEIVSGMKKFVEAKAKAKPTSYYEGFGTDELSGMRSKPEMFWGPGATRGKGKVETVPLSSITPTQLELDTKYIPELLKSGMPGDSDILEAVRLGDKLYLQDGHHRYSVLALAGKPEARVNVAEAIGTGPDDWKIIGTETTPAAKVIRGENPVSDLPGGAKLMLNRNGSYVKDPDTGRMIGNIWNTPEEAIAEFNKIKGYARGGSIKSTTWRPMELGGIIGGLVQMKQSLRDRSKEECRCG